VTERLYRASRLDRVLWSFQLVIGILFVGAVVFGFLTGFAGGLPGVAPDSQPSATSAGDLPIGVVVGALFWVALLACYVASARASVRVTAGGIELTPYLGRRRAFRWSEVSDVSAHPTSPYFGGLYGGGSWIEIVIALQAGRVARLQATRRPMSQRASVDGIRDELAADLARSRDGGA
jgi:hypothetical protein